MDGSVSMISSMRLADTMARGRMKNTMTIIMKPITTCMAYARYTIMSENSATCAGIRWRRR
jgi:hypothetical protein